MRWLSWIAAIGGLCAVLVAATAVGSLGAAGQSASCKKGFLHTEFRGKPKCLSPAARARIYDDLAKRLARARRSPDARRRVYRAVALHYRISSDAVRAIAREGKAKGWGREPGQVPVEPVPALKVDGPAAPGSVAATGLNAATDCTETYPRHGIAALSWKPADDGGASEQRVVVSILPDGFATGDFQASESLDPRGSALSWADVHGQAIHFWRVLTLRGQEWVASETGMFAGPVCPADLQP